MRRKARGRDEAVRRAERLEKELAITRALGPLNEVQTEAVMAVHKGDWATEPLLATAKTLGLEGTGWWAPVPTAELDALDRIANASVGAEHVAKVNPVDQIMSAGSREEVIAEYVKAGGRLAPTE